MLSSKPNQIIDIFADTKVPHDMASTLHTQRLWKICVYENIDLYSVNMCFFLIDAYMYSISLFDQRVN